LSDPIQRLVQRLARLPGVGEKTATRLAFHIVRGPAAEARELAESLLEVTEKIGLCSRCLDLTESEVCARCQDPARDPSMICVVASPSDVVAIDRAGDYRGLFHVLHGVLSPLDGVGPDDIHIAELVRRLGGSDALREVIVATSASVEGEATAMYLAKLIKPLGIQVSRIASGIPVGGELEYTDRATIARALSGRSPL